MTIVKTDNRMGETKDENVEKSVSNISGSILVSGVRSRDDGGKPDLFLVLRESVEDTHGGLHRHCLAVFGYLRLHNQPEPLCFAAKTAGWRQFFGR